MAKIPWRCVWSGATPLADLGKVVESDPVDRPNPHFPLRRDAARLGFERSGDPEADLGRSRC
jgi:hypothetical protein